MKIDAHVFRDKLSEVSKSSWIGNRAWWTKFVFHFSNIHNAVNILGSERLCSRNLAVQEELMVTDNASQEIIGITHEAWKDYVRFYFRPRTPTQFHNEGFKTNRMLETSSVRAHCPVPVFFLFDAVSMLSRDETHFTYGNLARNPSIFYTGDEFREMPFENIYHDDWRGLNDTIIFNRHAELVIKDQCDLKDLKYIVCRSQAEKETLIFLYQDSSGIKINKNSIIVNPSANLFFKKYFFVEKVSLSKDSISLNFNKGEYPSEVYWVRCELENFNTGEVLTWEEEELSPISRVKLNFHSDIPLYEATFYINGQIAYKNTFNNYEELLPF